MTFCVFYLYSVQKRILNEISSPHLPFPTSTDIDKVLTTFRKRHHLSNFTCWVDHPGNAVVICMYVKYPSSTTKVYYRWFWTWFVAPGTTHIKPSVHDYALAVEFLLWIRGLIRYRTVLPLGWKMRASTFVYNSAKTIKARSWAKTGAVSKDCNV